MLTSVDDLIQVRIFLDLGMTDTCYGMLNILSIILLDTILY